jgi:ectoine hydroxylase-related dioxygenase (phytanoyl-CoA dioxygenase family)
VRAVRRHPHIYSAVCKARLGYSRFVSAHAERALFRKHTALFAMNMTEANHCQELRNQGFTVMEDYFDSSLMDSILQKADPLFKTLKLDLYDAYSVQNQKRASLEGLTYEDLEQTEKMISLRDPLLQIPECVSIAYHESILKIVTNFLGYVAPWYKVMVLRDFPSDRPREASNFHRDNDETDSIQVFVYLVDIDDTRGPLIYVPRSNRYNVKSCRPRLSRDLGIAADDGRISDGEIEKYYPKESWRAVRVKRGSVAIIHGNGFHKGPAWSRYGDPRNAPRTALRMDFHGHRLRKDMRRKQCKISSKDYARLSHLQRLFVDDSAVIES